MPTASAEGCGVGRRRRSRTSNEAPTTAKPTGSSLSVSVRRRRGEDAIVALLQKRAQLVGVHRRLRWPRATESAVGTTVARLLNTNQPLDIDHERGTTSDDKRARATTLSRLRPVPAKPRENHSLQRNAASWCQRSGRCARVIDRHLSQGGSRFHPRAEITTAVTPRAVPVRPSGSRRREVRGVEPRFLCRDGVGARPVTAQRPNRAARTPSLYRTFTLRRSR
jgi:hypothetical protein